MTIKLDGFDEAIIGVTANSDTIVYDGNRIMQMLSEQNDFCAEDALEFMEYNIIGMYAGEYTPVIVWLDDPEGVLAYVATLTED
jgi:hypothetical protein